MLFAATALTCTDALSGPGSDGPTPIALAPQLSLQAQQAAQQLSGFELTIDNIHLVLVRPPSTVLTDTVIVVPPDASEMAVELSVQLEAAAETLSVQLQLRSQSTVLFSGTQSVIARRGENSGSEPTPVTLEYAGPGSGATRLSVSPLDTLVQATGHAQFSALPVDASGAPVQDLPIIWSSSDPEVAVVDPLGNATGMGAGTATITARGLNGLSAEASLTVTDPAVGLKLVSGDGQSGVIGTVLASPVVVKVVSASGGGVPGVAVRFRPQDTSVQAFDTTVVSGADGLAAARILLGDSLGVQLYDASSAGLLTVTFKLTGLVAPPNQQIVVQSGDGQTGPVGSTLQPLVVFVHDPAGQPVIGATVSWRVANGVGSLTTASTATDAKGIASNQIVLDTIAAPVSVVAATAETSVLFNLIAEPLAATKLVVVRQPSDSAISGLPFAVQPAVRLVDSYGNFVATAGQQVQARLGLGCDGPCLSMATPHRLLTSRTLQSDGELSLFVGAAEAVTLTPTHLAGDTIVSTDANGVASFRQLALYAFTGGYTLNFSVVDTGTVQSVSSAPVEISPGAPAFIESAIFPTTFTALTGSTVPPGSLPAVQVIDSVGNGIAGQPVQFSVPADGGTVTGTSQVTDQFGVATLGSWILPSIADTITVTATSGSLVGNPVTFTVLAAPPLAAVIEVMVGNDQDALPDSLLPSPFVARVMDAAGLPLAGQPISWALSGGDGTGTFGTGGLTTDTIIVSDDTGFVSVDFRFAGALGSTAVVSASAPSGATTLFAASALPTGTTVRWVGGFGTAPNAWNDASNWRPSIVPTASDTVFVPLNFQFSPTIAANVSVGRLFVGTGGLLNLADFTLAAAAGIHGSLGGGIVSNRTTPSLILTGPGLVEGNLPGLEVHARAVVDSFLVVNGDLAVADTGDLDVGTGTVAVTGTFSTSGSGVLTMDDAGVVQLSGDAVFDGGNETGRLLMGELFLSGNFSQLATTSPTSFVADSIHQTYVYGTKPQTISFATSGSSQSRFAYLTFQDTVGVTLTTNTYAGRDVSVGGVVTIPQGVTLTTGAQITLQTGAKLTLDGTIVKQACTDLGAIITGLGLGQWTCP